MTRQYPTEFNSLAAFLVVELSADGRFKFTGAETHEGVAKWVTHAAWKERPKNTVAQLKAYLQYCDTLEGRTFHLAFFPEGTPYAVIDFDYKNFDKKLASLTAEEAVRLKPKADANRAMMDDWLADLKERTYVAESKSTGGYHAIVEHPTNRRGIQNSGLPIDILGGGFIILTGRSVGHPELSSSTPDDEHTIKTYWPSLDDESILAEMGTLLFAGKAVSIHDTPVTTKESVSAEVIIERMMTWKDAPWYLAGKGDMPSKARGSNHTPRMAFLSLLAHATYGMPDAPELIWDIISNSYFALTHTPATSNTNKRRFTTPSQVNYIRRREIPLALGLIHADEVPKHAAAEAKIAHMLPSLARMHEGTRARTAAARAATEAARAAAAPPPNDRKVPTIPDVPPYEAAYKVLQSYRDNQSKPHEGWEKISTFLLLGAAVGSYCKGVAPAIVVIGGSGTGKANPKKHFNAVAFQKFGDEPFYDITSNATQGEAFRDGVSDKTMYVGLFDEAGSVLEGIGSGDPRYSSYQAFLPSVIDGDTINRSSRAKSSSQHQNIAVKNPRAALYFAMQPSYVAGYLDEYGINNGIVGRMTLFPPQFRDRAVAAAYYEAGTGPTESTAEVTEMLRVASTRAMRGEALWLKFECLEAIAARLHKQFPVYPVLEPIHARLGEMVKRWASVHYGIRTFSQPLEQRWITLEPQDVDFGFAMAQMHWDTLLYYIEVGDSAVGGERVKHKLIYQGVMKAIEVAMRVPGATTVALTKIKEKSRGFRGKTNMGNGRRAKFEISDIHDVMNELVGTGVLKTAHAHKGSVWGFDQDTIAKLKTRIAECDE